MVYESMKSKLIIGISLIASFCVGAILVANNYRGKVDSLDVKILTLESQLKQKEEVLNLLENKIKAVNFYYEVTNELLYLNSDNNFIVPIIELDSLTDEQVTLLTSPYDDYYYFTANEEENILEYDYRCACDEDYNIIEQPAKKPVIYVYGAYDGQRVGVSVDVNSNNKILCEYPKRNENGIWLVDANTDGTLTYNNQNYNYLYW